MRSYKTDVNNHVILSKDMKLIELIDANHELLSILLRLDIQLPFGDISVEEMCQRYGMSSRVFLMICQIYADPDFLFDSSTLTIEEMTHVIHYLRASHQYYLTDLLPTIGRGVEAVLEKCNPSQGKILRKFYADYTEEVRAHLGHEEEIIFPYVESLINGAAGDAYMAKYMDNHTDICDKIDDVKSIIIKYLPESCSTRERCDLIFTLYRMRDDLAKHTLVETNILTPVVIAYERGREL